jgi:hypothetical protein
LRWQGIFSFTNLEYPPAHLAIGGTCVRMDVLCGAYQIALYPGGQDCDTYLEPKIFGNRLVGVNSIGALLSVFRFTSQGF